MRNPWPPRQDRPAPDRRLAVGGGAPVSRPIHDEDRTPATSGRPWPRSGGWRGPAARSSGWPCPTGRPPRRSAGSRSGPPPAHRRHPFRPPAGPGLPRDRRRRLAPQPGTIGSGRRSARSSARPKSGPVPIRIGVNSGLARKGPPEKHGGATRRSDGRKRPPPYPDPGGPGFPPHQGLAQGLGRAADGRGLPPPGRESRLSLPRRASPKPERFCCGAVKSAVGLGLLLNEGLADTIRVSLTAPPEDEVRVAYQILAEPGPPPPGRRTSSPARPAAGPRWT